MFAVPSPSAQSTITTNRGRILFFGGLFAVLLAAHLRHAGVLWAEEDLPLAAALAMKRGAVIYRDVWFDKPPLVPAIYLLWGAAIGPALRVAGAIYALAACGFAYGIASTLWSRREGYVAAALMGFFLTFDTHSAVLPLAADLLLLVPHLAAIYFAVQRKPFWCGVAAGVGFLCNAKAVLVLAICGVFVWPSVLPLAAGFTVPNLIGLGWLWAAGALPFYIDQVWRWPSLYAGSPVVSDPVWNGLLRTLNWAGFHAAIVIAAVWFWVREGQWKFVAWAVVCYAGVVLGWRFFPRYFFLVLPVLVVSAAGAVASSRSAAARREGGSAPPAGDGRPERAPRPIFLLAVLLVVPFVRFVPRYVSLSNWSDLALDSDSRAASKIVQSLAPAGASLYVWGYRPEIFVYTGLKPATRYLECQAMTGVPADRHLTQSTVVLTDGTHAAREELAHSEPDVLVDGLSLYNPALAMANYPELRSWLLQYREAARTKGAIIYLRTKMR
ncbi:MAG: hypothetical protein KGN84_14585 [Acidobacteriota bacterium]|nr:hypothetical protein [Acidobacteriota bacterium]